MRVADHWVSGLGYMVSEAWPLPAGLLRPCILYEEKIRVLIDIKCLTRDEKLVASSVKAFGAPSFLS